MYRLLEKLSREINMTFSKSRKVGRSDWKLNTNTYR